MPDSAKPKFRGREHRLGIVPWTPFSNVERVVLVLASLLCGGVCICVGDLLGIPREPHFNGSILLGGAAVSGVIVVAVAIACCMVIGLAIAAFFSLEAGLFCTCIGLAFFAVRCGPIAPVLQYASGKSVLIWLAVESIILGALLIGGWFGLQFVFHRFHPEPALDADRIAPNETQDATLSQQLATLAVQVVGMAICQEIIIQTDLQAQAMAGTLISAFVGAITAYMFQSLPQGIWYWTGPIVLGTIGYLLAYLFAGSTTIGELTGWTAPLGRPTPLMYLSMGTAGALLGYWSSRRWAQPEGDGTAAILPIANP